MSASRSTPPTLAELEDEAAGLVLSQFNEETALRLGLILIDLAEGLPVVIDIRTPNRTLFHASLSGSAETNDNWARRKSNSTLMFGAASLLVGTRHREKGETLAKHGLDPADYADHGGAVPLVVRNVGMVAVATVSGLPQLEDHQLVVRGIEALIAH
jgi:uncharacterized protein (UPF0303 family)